MPYNIQEGITYRIGDHPSVKNDWAVVELLLDPYKGILVKFGEISFGHENVDGTLDCNFSYDIIEDAGNSQASLETSTVFNNLLGDIAIDIIGKNLDTGFKDKDENVTYVDEDRTEDTKISD